MTCNETQSLLNAYIDGELDSSGSLSVESHLQTCASCGSAVDRLRVLSARMQEGALRFQAPAQLQRKIQRAIQAANPETRNSFIYWRWVAAVAALALIVVSWQVTTHRAGGSGDDAQLVKSIVASHIRSLMVNHITDVSSSDSHTVKPWFSGKLDYSPPARDLTEKGFRLVGGRLDYLENRPVAALVYQRNQHVINLFVWPSTTSVQNEQRMQDGYNIIHWTQNGMTFWLISDLNMTELNECATLLKE